MALNAHETATEINEAPTQINELNIAQKSRPTLAARLEQRRVRRRNNRKTLDGLERAHDRLIAMVEAQQIPDDFGDRLSRMYLRHKDLLAAKYTEQMAKDWHVYVERQQQPTTPAYGDYGSDADAPPNAETTP